jgi:hypothetical protein
MNTARAGFLNIASALRSEKAPTPPQGRWRIYGIGLPDQILAKVYSGNAARILGL